MNRAAHRVRSLVDARYATVYFAIVLFVFFVVQDGHRFIDSTNMYNILEQSAILGVAAIGFTVPLIVGQFDLSVGWLASFAAVLGTNLAVTHGTWTAIILVLVVGLLGGLANGLIITRLGVVSIIATLATGTMFVGGSQKIAQSMVHGIPDSYLWLGQARVDEVPVSAIIMLALGFVLWIATTQTTFGRTLHAVGDNEEASQLFGLRVKAVILSSMVICAMCAALAGILLSSRLGQGTFGAGDGLLLDGVTAAAIGSVTFRRGQYNIAGTMFAVLLLTMMYNGMTIAGWADYWQSLFKAVVLVAAVALANYRRAKTVRAQSSARRRDGSISDAGHAETVDDRPDPVHAASGNPVAQP